jgi:ABC-type antimicrobial peptide transport system permease subunit
MTAEDFLSIAETWRTKRFQVILLLLTIAFGTAALTVGINIISGVHKTIHKIIAGPSGTLMTIYPHRDPVQAQQKVTNFTLNDAWAIAGITAITSISLRNFARRIPVNLLGQQLQIGILGTDPNFMMIHNRTIAKGRFLVTSDLWDRQRVCVINEQIQKRYFPAGDYLEHGLEIDGITFRIIGCLHPKPLPYGFGAKIHQETIFIPITTYQDLFHQYNYDRIWLSYAPRYDSGKKIKILRNQIERILRFRHDADEVFVLKTLGDMTHSQWKTTIIMMVILSSLALLCIIIGWIGIISIVATDKMKMVQKTIPRDMVHPGNFPILHWFLGKSFFISAVGGGSGLVFGIFSSKLISVFTGIPTNPPWWGLLSEIGSILFMGAAAGGFLTKKHLQTPGNDLPERSMKEGAH